jgi:hypothetical protein
MDWRVMLTTFGVVFLAEMGDKTHSRDDHGLGEEAALGSLHRCVIGVGGRFSYRRRGWNRVEQVLTA